jgi:hypothetical protein
MTNYGRNFIPAASYFFTVVAVRRSNLRKPRKKTGTGNLAASLLGTHAARRSFSRHSDIHFNPVRHGHVVDVQDWPYSSFHRMVRLGVYPKDWARDVGDGAEFGE